MLAPNYEFKIIITYRLLIPIDFSYFFVNVTAFIFIEIAILRFSINDNAHLWIIEFYSILKLLT